MDECTEYIYTLEVFLAEVCGALPYPGLLIGSGPGGVPDPPALGQILICTHFYTTTPT